MFLRFKSMMDLEDFARSPTKVCFKDEVFPSSEVDGNLHEKDILTTMPKSSQQKVGRGSIFSTTMKVFVLVGLAFTNSTHELLIKLKRLIISL